MAGGDARVERVRIIAAASSRSALHHHHSRDGRIGPECGPHQQADDHPGVANARAGGRHVVEMIEALSNKSLPQKIRGSLSTNKRDAQVQLTNQVRGLRRGKYAPPIQSALEHSVLAF